MWYGAIFILLAAYLFEAGGAGYWTARKDWIKVCKKTTGALSYLLITIFIITHFI